jgi:glutamate synthase (NADPH/NADH) large chain
MIGQMQMLDRAELIDHAKARGLDFSKLFTNPEAPEGVAIYHCEAQDHRLDAILDRKLIEEAKGAIETGTPVKIESAIRNTDRATGAMLSGTIVRRYDHAGLPDDTIHIKLKGTAGQSFGAWLARGVTMELEGEANDYVGKGLSGGRLIVYPAREAEKIVPEDSIIVGNTVLYGAVEGECYFRGVAGERFAVRNSGAVAVVEGAGDHCCEYMTGGVVVVLGRTGRNFAAGMSGGIAYVLDEDDTFEARCNLAMVELEAVAAEEDAIARHYHQAGDLDTHGRVDVLEDLTRFDAERLRQLVANHARLTGSKRAEAILAAWSDYLPKFRKVMPVEYRRALQEMERARNLQAAE